MQVSQLQPLRKDENTRHTEKSELQKPLAGLSEHMNEQAFNRNDHEGKINNNVYSFFSVEVFLLSHMEHGVVRGCILGGASAIGGY